MRVAAVTAAALLALGAQGQEDAVRVVTDANFAEQVEKEDLILVEYYAPWCGHCKQLAPKYEEAAKILLQNDPPIPLAKVDATEEKKIAGKAGVSGYPTMKIYRNGEVSDYEGGRETDDIVTYMKQQLEPASTELKTTKELKDLINKKTLDRVVVVGFFSSTAGDDYKTFFNVANKFRGKFEFFHVQSHAVLEGIGFYGSTSTVGIYRPWAGGKHFKKMFTGSLHKESLKSFVLDNMFAPVGFVTRDNMEFFQQKQKPIVRAFVPAEQKDTLVKKLTEVLTPVQKKHSNLLFVINDAEFGTEYGFDEATLAAGEAIVVDEMRKKFVYDKERWSSVGEWVEKYVAKEAPSWVKSEAPVPRAEAGEVQVVVGKTFNDIVMDGTKDVLLEIYAPWCGHCKALEPKYVELAKELKGDSNIIIAKIDGTANDIEHKAYQAGGFPTILYARAGSKDSPMSYEGAREVADMAEWVRSNAQSTQGEL